VDDAGKLAERRLRMVEEQIVQRGVIDVNVVSAMRSVPRHLFVPPEREPEAYADEALPIGRGQTISQPYMVALMTQLLRLDVRKKILDVGSGSGYQTAVLCELAGEVFAIERIPELAERSRAVLEKLGYDNVTVVTGDGTLGLPEQAPFDGILVAAAAPEAPRPLLTQLADGGRLVVPLGPVHREQMLTVFTREGTGFRRDEHVYCRFVPLIGEEGLGGHQGDGAV
jgi:protein-L-isoaspartate(D-aspartate) O-methyltransferase